MAEPETDIATSAIKWLCDDPTFDPSEGAEMIRVALKALGAEDPDDPLLVALVIEGVLATRSEALTPLTVAGWRPELCGDDPNRRDCKEPVSGTGRCMTCGSQRREPEKLDPAIKAAQESDQEPLTAQDIIVEAYEKLTSATLEWVDGHVFDDEIQQTVNPDAAFRELSEIAAKAPNWSEPTEPRIVHSGPAEVPYRKWKPRRLKRPVIIKAYPHLDAPNASAIELVRLRVVDAVRADLPLMLRLKGVTGLSDQELGDIMGRSRATIQAYAQGNRNEVLGPNQLRALGDVLRMHYNVLADLMMEVEAAQCPSEN